MADTEEYFPRGGKKPTFKDFKQTSNFLGDVEKGEKKKKRPKKKVAGDDGYLSDEVDTEFEQSTKYCAVGLSYQTVKEGLLILGRVSRVMETKVLVSLPNRMRGSVMACHISEAYNKLLEAYVADQIASVRPLSSMFRPGQYVACKLLEAQEERLMLSVMPQHLHSGRSHQDLQKGALLQAAVSSVEDHGFVMDLGIPNTRAFLPKTNTNEEVELDTGVLTWCTIKSVTVSPEASVVTLSNEPQYLQRACKRKPARGVAGLIPGAPVEFIVDKALENGIEGHIFDGITGYVQRHHADTVNGKKPALGQRVQAYLLYEMPTRKSPFLTLRSIFETTYPDLATEQEFQEGDIVENAQVIKVTSRSVVFRLRARCVGTMSLKRVRVDENMTDEEVVAKSYPLGSEHKVRVLFYNLSDYRYSVSDSPDILRLRVLSARQLSAGDLVSGSVAAVTDHMLTVQVDRVQGIVPHTHMTDAGVYVNPKKPTAVKLPKKKFKVGQPVSARVLHVNPDSGTVVLTLKPSLLARDLELLKSYEDAAVGKGYTGAIKYIADDYILVSFFANVMAYVRKQYVTKVETDDLREAFHVGQIVNCTILKVDPEAKKMVGSLTTAPFWPNKKLERGEKRKNTEKGNSEEPTKKRKISEESEAESGKAKKKKEKKPKPVSEEAETESVKTKKKKYKTAEQAPEVTESEAVKTKTKKGKIPQSELETEVIETQEKNKAKKKKDKKDDRELTNEEDNQHKHSEESDAIETDFQDEEVLKPQDMILIDMSECTTKKNFKKRVVSITKALTLRVKRIDTIEKKIQAIEEKGIHAKNKKHHTAMHSEKIIIEERIKHLVQALKRAQEKIKEFPEDELNEYQKQKLEKAAAKKNKKNNKKPKNTKSEDNEEKPSKKNKPIKENKEEEIKENAAEERKKDKILKEKVKEIKIADSKSVLEVPSVKDFWSTDVSSLYKPVEKEDDLSSSDEEKQEQPKKKRKKLTVAEKVAKAREEEERLRELERLAIESASRPQSVEQFERALLASPDSSQLWIAYMAFHLQATEIEKARAVGRKAVATISFREEQEKLNVWLAMLNFEHRFGNKETQQATLEEALQLNDTYSIHSKLLDILTDTASAPELASLVDLMLRKYRRQTPVYAACGAACYKLGLVDKARQVMQKAIGVLEKKEHVSVLVQFALLERDSGERERAEALFEQVLGVYPGRVDVCAAYADMLVKEGDAERVRQVMERMTSQKLPARKMKILYKKWIEVEEKIGDESQVERIRQKAMEFIENAKF